MATVYVGVIEWGSEHDDMDIVTIAAETEFAAQCALVSELNDADHIDERPSLPSGASPAQIIEAYRDCGPWCTINQVEVVPAP